MAYTFMVLGTFAVVTVVSGPGDGATSLSDFRGLAQRRPVLALAFTILLMAQAGVPLTSGFMAKFQVIAAAVDAESYWLALVAMLAAVIAAVLYLRIIVSMYLTDSEVADDDRARLRVPIGATTALALTVTFTLVVGFVPSLIIDFAHDAVPVLVAATPTK